MVALLEQQHKLTLMGEKDGKKTREMTGGLVYHLFSGVSREAGGPRKSLRRPTKSDVKSLHLGP